MGTRPLTSTNELDQQILLQVRQLLSPSFTLEILKSAFHSFPCPHVHRDEIATLRGLTGTPPAIAGPHRRHRCGRHRPSHIFYRRHDTYPTGAVSVGRATDVAAVVGTTETRAEQPPRPSTRWPVHDTDLVAKPA